MKRPRQRGAGTVTRPPVCHTSAGTDRLRSRRRHAVFTRFPEFISRRLKTAPRRSPGLITFSTAAWHRVARSQSRNLTHHMTSKYRVQTILLSPSPRRSLPQTYLLPTVCYLQRSRCRNLANHMTSKYSPADRVQMSVVCVGRPLIAL